MNMERKHLVYRPGAEAEDCVSGAAVAEGPYCLATGGEEFSGRGIIFFKGRDPSQVSFLTQSPTIKMQEKIMTAP